jgi:hypothetical protein
VHDTDNRRVSRSECDARRAQNFDPSTSESDQSSSESSDDTPAPRESDERAASDRTKAKPLRRPVATRRSDHPPLQRQNDDEGEAKAVATGSESDLQFLDTIIRSQAQERVEQDSASPPASWAWSLDEDCLNVDVQMGRKFGSETVQQPRHAGRPSSRAPRKRRCTFFKPRDEWPRPPLFIVGGIRCAVVKHDAAHCSEQIEFETSEAYDAATRSLETLEASHDPTALVMFLAENPSHVQGLLQLATVCAHTGHMDRASDLVRQVRLLRLPRRSVFDERCEHPG